MIKAAVQAPAPETLEHAVSDSFEQATRRVAAEADLQMSKVCPDAPAPSHQILALEMTLLPLKTAPDCCGGSPDALKHSIWHQMLRLL